MKAKFFSRFMLFAVMFSPLVGYASACDNVVVTIQNNTDRNIVLHEKIQEYGQFDEPPPRLIYYKSKGVINYRGAKPLFSWQARVAIGRVTYWLVSQKLKKTFKLTFRFESGGWWRGECSTRKCSYHIDGKKVRGCDVCGAGCFIFNIDQSDLKP